jgi:hypothetical protein
MGLFGSQAGNEKKLLVVNYEQLLRAVFSCFHGQNFIFYFLHCRVRTEKLLDTKVKKKIKKFGKYFRGLKIVFLGLAVLVL